MKYGLIGERLGHSFSKEIHEAIADYEYELCELSPDTVEGFIKAREFSFVSDEKTTRDEEILFASIEKIEIVRQARDLTFGKVTYNAKTCELVITYDGGKTCTLPVKDDIYAEEFAERLERIAKKTAQ